MQNNNFQRILSVSPGSENMKMIGKSGYLGSGLGVLKYFINLPVEVLRFPKCLKSYDIRALIDDLMHSG